MTYAEEKKLKDAEKARKAKKYRYEPVLFDTIKGPQNGLAPGDIVVKVQPYGCPRNGTMGMTYVGHPETGEFIGQVMLNSLTPVKPKALKGPGYTIRNGRTVDPYDIRKELEL